MKIIKTEIATGEKKKKFETAKKVAKAIFKGILIGGALLYGGLLFTRGDPSTTMTKFN